MFVFRPFAHRGFLLMALLMLVCAAPPRPAAQTAPAPPPQPRPAPTPEQLAMRAAAEKDHQLLMEKLGIRELRPGASHDPQSPNAVNYDERKANVYPSLPDPLTLNDGRRVTSAKDWWSKRRQEIVEEFDREILGRAPVHLP